MTSAISRWAIVDDTDKRIEYQGAWVQQSAHDFAQTGNFGQAFGSTVKAVTAGVASLSFQFNGTEGAILGTSANTDAGAFLDPTWQCFIDGVNIPSVNATLNPQNNFKFCEWTNISDGEHTVTVNVTSVDHPFYFDRINYAPSPSDARAAGEVISISYADQMLVFDSSWKEFNSLGMIAGEHGANLTFSFTGTSLSWYGMGPVEYPLTSSNGTYRIDGGDPVTFDLADLNSAGIPNSRFNELFFEAQNLSPGNHSITVIYQGDTTLRPLTLSSIVVNNQHEDLTSRPTAGRAVPVPAIIGAALGGFFFILAIILAIFWYRFHRKQSYQHVSHKEKRAEIDPFYVDLSPYQSYKVSTDLSEEFEPLTGISRDASMVGLDKHLVDPFAIPGQSPTPSRRSQLRLAQDMERFGPARTPSFEILLSAPPPNVRSSGIVAVRLRRDSIV